MPNWLSINPTSGTGRTTISVAPLSYNTGNSTRGVIITATNKRTGARAVLYVSQEPIPDNTLLDLEGNVLLDSDGSILLSNG